MLRRKTALQFSWTRRTFSLRDSHNVIGTLRRTQQGPFRLDASARVLFAAHEKFPEEHGSRSHSDFHERRAGPVCAAR